MISTANLTSKKKDKLNPKYIHIQPKPLKPTLEILQKQKLRVIGIDMNTPTQKMLPVKISGPVTHASFRWKRMVTKFIKLYRDLE